jgi:RNA polymerase sigma factor (sigma-70 family)
MVGNSANLETPDGFLLESFIAERDQAAFDCLLKRHAPMVYRTCLRIVRDPHHAEDAFQATFLVLCRKARSIRRQDSVAGWLYQVAARISLKLRADSQREAPLDNHVPDVSAPENPCSFDAIDFRLALDGELSKLPEKYRAPLILHYLESKPAVAVARELGWPYGTVLCRMARGRDKLRARFMRRGICLGAESLWVSELARIVEQGSVPAGLVNSAIKLAVLLSLGQVAAQISVAPKVAELAQGMARALLLTKLKSGLCLFVGLAGMASAIGLGLTYIPAAQNSDPSKPKPAAAKRSVIQTVPRADTSKYQVTGTVRDESTGAPVAGATVEVQTGDSSKENRGNSATTKSGKDGIYAFNLPAGHYETWAPVPPAGYWFPTENRLIGSFALTQAEPVGRHDYLVRRGTRWNFKISSGASKKVGPGFVGGFRLKGPQGNFRGVATDSGLICLTLPTEAGQVSAMILEDIWGASSSKVTLEWDEGFRTDSVKSMVHLDGTPAQYRLTDAAGKKASISSADQAVPVLEHGSLVIRVALQQPDAKNRSDLTGKVLDKNGKPIEKALVSLIYVEGQGSAMSPDKRHQASTDVEGKYLLQSVAPGTSEKEPVMLKLSVSGEGFAGIDTEPFRFEPVANGLQTVDPVRLTPGMSVHGIVLDVDGKPAAGAWVMPRGSYAARSQFAKTDGEGRFTVQNLAAGLASLRFKLGQSYAESSFMTGPSPQPVIVRLRSLPVPAKGAAAEQARQAIQARLAAPPTPPAGAPAPEWDTGPWSDGKTHKLSDYRGKVVFLDFWGIWCGPCLHGLPIVEKLKSKYEKRGVVFLSIHTPGDDEKTIRQLLDSKKVSIPFALDVALPRADIDKLGVSSERFGIKAYPTYFLIDRGGKIAFRSDDDAAIKTVFLGIVKSFGFDEKTITEDQASQVIERFLEKQIEMAVGQK